VSIPMRKLLSNGGYGAFVGDAFDGRKQHSRNAD
jgi:hypothetical protein